MPRHAFFISDRTGITVESMAEALLNQFSSISFIRHYHPFVDTHAKAQETVDFINRISTTTEERPLVFSSIVDEDIRCVVQSSIGLHLSFFDAFIGQLENELAIRASRHIGGIHSIRDPKHYDARMEAVNFSLNHDDGASDRELQKADIILMGVSRSGKTPTCLYMALQYGIRAANYPLTPDDLDKCSLPRMVEPFRSKIHGLTIEPARLNQIRNERRPYSQYASLDNCRKEVRKAESLFSQHDIPFTNTTHKSVEELATAIMLATRIRESHY